MDILIQLLLLIFFVYLMTKVMKYIFTIVGFGFLFASSNDNNSSSTGLSNTTKNSILAFFKHQKIKNKNGFMKKGDQSKLFKFMNKGLLLDGKNKRLSLKDSFNPNYAIAKTINGYIIYYYCQANC